MRLDSVRTQTTQLRFLLLHIFRFSLLLLFTAPAANAALPAGSTVIADGWTLHSGCGLQATGDRISRADYATSGWMPVTVPSTVLAAQVADGMYKDPYYAQNLRSIPGTNYPVGSIFSNLPMPQDSPYRCAFWYRRQFKVGAMPSSGHLWMHFAGINYRANIWLNGTLVATDKQIAGAYRTYDLDVTGAAHKDGDNVVAVETFAPTQTDLGINWVDWNPSPPDKDMGLVGEVDTRVGGPVLLRSPMVTTHFLDSSLDAADLTVTADLRNSSAETQHATVAVTLLGHTLTQAVTLSPWQTTTIDFSPGQFPALHVHHPEIWWPYQMGTPHLEALQTRVSTPGTPAEELTTHFGIREVTSTLTPNHARLFFVNGKRVMVRGGGWSQDMLLREDPRRLAQELALTRDLHLNAIRLEGKLETDDFFDLADQQGILVLAGWCCCDQWEHWNTWTPENYAVAADSVRSQMLRLRGHASLLVWLNGSDNRPIPFVERAYLQIEREEQWPNPVLSSASGEVDVVSGVAGVKMTGPYDFVAPSYWLADTGKYGGAWGFNTETGPGPAIPMPSSLRKFLPPDQMVPESPDWQYHDGSGKFANLTVFDTAMRYTYGAPHALADYERYAQTMAYDGERAMYEAYERQKYVTTTGIVQWMLNNAWPSNIWHLFDYYLDAGGGYYGARMANQPLHGMYSYDDHSIVVINNLYAPAAPIQVKTTVYDLSLRPEFTKTQAFTAPPDSSTRLFLLPKQLFDDAKGVQFVDIRLLDAAGKEVGDNFYWIPAKLTTWDWAKTDYTHTPAATYEDLTALNSLPPAQLTTHVTRQNGELALTLFNSSHALAFQVFPRALGADGQAIDPAFWSDSYIELLPGETRTLTVHLDSEETQAKIATVTVAGWNVAEQRLTAGGR